ncbi:GNAT family N-acetyltransferase [Spirosoma spitsbergense]|uniref:GNAT family N-acetyltransferase n=1 Tax=Spirosoma spitsbergense TaxID=431554 RepID=UPI00037CA8CA|nr:GNAT family N-acetyltransferase [Spirosoma spitsbergense]
MISITPATEAQLSIVQTIAHQTWPTTFAAILSPEQIDYMLEMMYSTDSLKTQMDGKNHVFLLAQERDNGNYLGFLSYELNYRGVPKTKIHKIYLLPASQGKGVGKQLIEAVTELAKAKQNNTLSLNVNRHNKAILFYERLGFRHVANETIDIGNGFIMDDYVMEKSL